MSSIFQSFDFQQANIPNTKLYVNSIDRDASESEVQFTVTFDGSQLDQTHAIRVHTVNIPNLFKNVEAGSNVVDIELSDASVISIAIPPGFYNVLDLAQEIVDSFNVAVAPESLSFVYNSATGLLSFTIGGGPRTFQFNVSSPLEFANQDIARDKLKMPIGVLSASQDSLTPVNLFPRVEQVFVAFEFVFGNFDTTSADQQNFVIGLPVVTQFGTTLQYKDNGDQKIGITFPVSQNLRLFRVRVVDKDNRLIRDLDGFDWNITLAVDTQQLR